MRPTVDLDDKALLAADEVGEVGANWHLPDELVAAQLAIAQATPEDQLCGDVFGTERPRPAREPGLPPSDHGVRPWLPLTPTLSPL